MGKKKQKKQKKLKKGSGKNPLVRAGRKHRRENKSA